MLNEAFEKCRVWFYFTLNTEYMAFYSFMPATIIYTHT